MTREQEEYYNTLYDAINRNITLAPHQVSDYINLRDFKASEIRQERSGPISILQNDFEEDEDIEDEDFADYGEVKLAAKDEQPYTQGDGLRTQLRDDVKMKYNSYAGTTTENSLYAALENDLKHASINVGYKPYEYKWQTTSAFYEADVPDFMKNDSKPKKETKLEKESENKRNSNFKISTNINWGHCFTFIDENFNSFPGMLLNKTNTLGFDDPVLIYKDNKYQIVDYMKKNYNTSNIVNHMTFYNFVTQDGKEVVNFKYDRNEGDLFFTKDKKKSYARREVLSTIKPEVKEFLINYDYPKDNIIRIKDTVEFELKGSVVRGTVINCNIDHSPNIIIVRLNDSDTEVKVYKKKLKKIHE